MKKIITALVLAGLTGGAYAADFGNLAVTASQLKAEAVNTAVAETIPQPTMKSAGGYINYGDTKVTRNIEADPKDLDALLAKIIESGISATKVDEYNILLNEDVTVLRYISRSYPDTSMDIMKRDVNAFMAKLEKSGKGIVVDYDIYSNSDEECTMEWNVHYIALNGKKSAGQYQTELARVNKILSFGGGIPEKDAIFMNAWFPKFRTEGKIGRVPTDFERKQVAGWFPKLAEKNDWLVTGEACRKYNCISWSAGITSEWAWPGDTAPAFDKFYLSYGYVPLAAGESEDKAVIAYWEDAKGGSTHGCRRVAGDIWESKLGSSLRILHRLNELEGDSYGHVAKLFRRATTEELASLGVTPKDPGGNGIDPCKSASKAKNLGAYDMGSPSSRP